MTSLEGKVIAITGAASGIGLATSHLLASRGAAISIADVRQEPLEAAVANIKKSVPNAKIFHEAVNVAKADEVGAWLDETVKELGGLHGAANLAGILKSTGKDVKELTDDDWDAVLDVNLRGVFNCVRAELQRMEKDASIVNASSVAGLKGYKKGSAYSEQPVRLTCLTPTAKKHAYFEPVQTSKHGVIGLTKSAAQEEGHRNIRLNCINPGAVDTPMTQPFFTQSTVDGMPLCIPRMGKAEEIAKLIAFLLSDESTYITGSCYNIDGGYMS